MSGPLASCDIEIRVRYAEVDAMGYLHHSAYFVYFEMGRTELLRQNGLRYRDLEQRGIFYVVAQAECRFRWPVYYDDLLTLRTTTTRLTRLRIDHGYQLIRDGRILADASTTLVCVGRDGKATPVPEDVYRILTGARDSEPRA